MFGLVGWFVSIYDWVYVWVFVLGGNGVMLIDYDDVKWVFGEICVIWWINELFNWQVVFVGEDINMVDVVVMKVFGIECVQCVGWFVEEIVGKYGNFVEFDIVELLCWLDVQIKCNLVIIFGGGVNEVMCEMIVVFGFKVLRVFR